MSNPLTDVLPAKLRKLIYAVVGFAALLVGAVQTVYGAMDLGQPGWTKGALALLAYLGGALGLTAASNTATPPERDGTVNEVEDGLEDTPQPVQTDNSPRPEDPVDQPIQDPNYIPPSDDDDEEDMA